MRHAFTLLELLVVIVILAILVGLFLPASENVRRAGSRMRCKMNLQQLAMGSHNYRDTHGHFPPGTVPDTQLITDHRLSFHVILLPYIEQEAAFQKFRLAMPWDAVPNSQAATFAIAYRFECGEWSSTEQGMLARRKLPRTADAPALTTYVGMAGVGEGAATRPDDAPGIGMFGHDRTLKTEQVKDGLANTMLLIETGSDVGPWVRGGTTTVRPLLPDSGHLTGDGLPFGGTHIRDRSFFRGRAPDGFHLVLADCSTRVMKNEVDPNVLAALATVAGGEEIPPY